MYRDAPPVHPLPGFTEPFSSLSHLLGVLALLIIGVMFVRRAHGHRGRQLGLLLFVFAGVFTLSMSATYHMLPLASTGRAVLRRLDHAAIFLMIAATFTPVHGILFERWGRWGMLGLIWTVGILGIVLKTIFFGSFPESLSLALYLGMGWLGLYAGVMLARRHGLRFITWLLIGAFAYTIGALVDYLRWPEPIPGVINAHEVFHIFVLAGLAAHARFLWQIAPPPESAHAALVPAQAVGSRAAG